jgi:hypothetical protein
MKDMKMLFLIVLSMGVLAAGWWFGWFGGVTKMFLAIKQNTVHP